MAVVILVDGSASGVAIEALAVEGGVGVVGFVVLEKGIFAHPGPDTGAVLAKFVASFGGVFANVVFDEWGF